jgi:hypothetical protein
MRAYWDWLRSATSAKKTQDIGNHEDLPSREERENGNAALGHLLLIVGEDVVQTHDAVAVPLLPTVANAVGCLALSTLAPSATAAQSGESDCRAQPIITVIPHIVVSRWPMGSGMQ